jgi:hypothetical protein
MIVVERGSLASVSEYESRRCSPGERAKFPATALEWADRMNSMPMGRLPTPARKFVDYKQPGYRSGFEATIISATLGVHATKPSVSILTLWF